MSEAYPEPPPQEPPSPAEPAAADPARTWSASERERGALEAHGRRPRSRAVAWLAALLILVIVGVATSPFWAPAVIPLLPWGQTSSSARDQALAGRLAAVERRPVATPAELDTLRAAQSDLVRRVAAVETGLEALRRNQEAAIQTKTLVGQLAQRVDAMRQSAEAGAAAQAAIARLGERVDTVAAQATATAASEKTEIDKIRQQVDQSARAVDAVANRIDGIEHRLQAESSADRSGSALLLVLLQMREAIEQARPFASEYDAFRSFAGHDPELLAAAGPLADAAREGVASRAVLRQRLADLADHVAAAPTPSVKTQWWAEALDRLRGLVTIRHISGSQRTGPEAALDTAQRDLAQGDLAGAVAAVETLAGADASAAEPWLRIARRRLAAETALARLQGLLAARLGAAAALAPASSPQPAPPAPPPVSPPPAKTPLSPTAPKAPS
jgi:hypothetical protein